jgi:flagellin-specific chaperone FliS
MKSIAIFGILILTASLVLGGMTNTVFAQENPSILSQIANRAQEQIQNQISNDSSEEIKKLFEKGKKEVEALEESLSNNDLTSAKKYFLSSMKIFTQISHQLNTIQTSQTSTSMIQTAKNPSIDLLRMQGYVNNLKVIVKNNNASMDFSSLDQSFEIARNQIDNNQFKEASQTIHEIKKIITELNTELRQQTSQQETNRAQAFAQKYLKQLDRLIEHGQNTGMPEDIMQKFESARESLTLAISPSEVIKEVRKILLLQQQFEISENKLVELRIIQTEKTVLELSKLDQVNQDTIQEIKETLQTIKDHLSKNEFEQANELLRSLATTLEQIQI